MTQINGEWIFGDVSPKEPQEPKNELNRDADFRNKPYKSIAREVIQNSLDARDDSEKPVKVLFEAVSLEKGGALLKGLEHVFHRDLEALWSQDKVVTFLETGRELLQQEKIPCLKISDYNTTGITIGKLKKLFAGDTDDDVESGGSFGIGNYAAFSRSQLKSIIYETITDDPSGGLMKILTGRSFLVGHYNEGQLKRGEGYYYDNKNIDETKSIQFIEETIEREEKGTTLWILGFNEDLGWKDKIVSSILTNYFHAIYANLLNISIENLIEINSSNLDELFNSQILRDPGDTDLYNAFSFYSALVEGDIIEFDIEIFGKFRIYILHNDDFKNKCAYIRRGMLIKPRAIRGVDKNFAAVVECMSLDGNKILRDMEPPQHDDFYTDRIEDIKERRSIKKAYGALNTRIREEIIKSTEISTGLTDTWTLDILNDLLPFSSAPKSGGSDDEDAETESTEGGSSKRGQLPFEIERLPQTVKNNDVINQFKITYTNNNKDDKDSRDDIKISYSIRMMQEYDSGNSKPISVVELEMNGKKLKADNIFSFKKYGQYILTGKTDYEIFGNLSLEFTKLDIQK